MEAEGGRKEKGLFPAMVAEGGCKGRGRSKKMMGESLVGELQCIQRETGGSE